MVFGVLCAVVCYVLLAAMCYWFVVFLLFAPRWLCVACCLRVDVRVCARCCDVPVPCVMV